MSRHISKSRQSNHRYNRFHCSLSDCVADSYRYIILATFEYRNIALADNIAFTELVE